MKDDGKVRDKIEEKKIANYVGQPVNNKQDFLKAKTF
tara:strand:- start:229 stop:339 length:111 start_codon:yes stop_codon:yes gene_type:complete